MVAKTLLAAQNQQFVLEALPAPGRPWRGGKALRNSDVEGDAPLVFRPRLAPAAVQQFDQGDCIENLIVVRRDFQAAAHVGEGLRKPPEQIECLGAVRVE